MIFEIGGHVFPTNFDLDPKLSLKENFYRILLINIYNNVLINYLDKKDYWNEYIESFKNFTESKFKEFTNFDTIDDLKNNIDAFNNSLSEPFKNVRKITFEINDNERNIEFPKEDTKSKIFLDFKFSERVYRGYPEASFFDKICFENYSFTPIKKYYIEKSNYFEPMSLQEIIRYSYFYKINLINDKYYEISQRTEKINDDLRINNNLYNATLDIREWGGKIVINRCFIGLYHKYNPELYAKIHSIAKKLYNNFYAKINAHTWSENYEKTLLIKYTQEEFKGYGSLKDEEYMDFVPLVNHYYNLLKMTPDFNNLKDSYNKLNKFIIKNHKIIDESIIFDPLLVLHDEYQKYKSSEEDKNSDLKIESFEKFNKLFEISQNISKIQPKELDVFKDFINESNNLKESFKNNKISIFDYYLFKAICKNFINEVKLKNINEVVELKNINKAKVAEFKNINQEVMDRDEKIKNPKIIGALLISSLSVSLMSIIPFYLNNPNLGYTILGIGLSIAVLGIATLLILDRDIYLARWNNNLDLKKSELNEEQQKIVTDNNTIINDINQIINDLQSIDGAPKFDDKDPDTTLNSHNSTNLISNELNK